MWAAATWVYVMWIQWMSIMIVFISGALHDSIGLIRKKNNADGLSVFKIKYCIWYFKETIAPEKSVLAWKHVKV